MVPGPEIKVEKHRLVLFCLGGIAGLALWGLAEHWDNPALAPPLYLALFTFVATYCGVALALAGPVPVMRALWGALLIGVPLTLLVSLAGLRHVVATDLLDAPVMLAMVGVLVFVSTPFLLVWLQAPQDWRSYGALFDTAWSLTVRYGVAGVFVGLFWLVLFLSDALFDLVGLALVERLISLGWAPFLLTGAVLGLGLAVVYELRTTISAFLILRLLRLLVPVLLVVLVVFLAAVPLHGLSDVFGALSAAATLMGAAIVAITLVTAALDRDDTRAVQTRGLRIATRVLAVLLPLLALLAVWAVVIRVRQYGWTPDRVLATATAVFVLAYGVGYAVAALRGAGWRARVRRVNVAMALAVIVVSALWMTPVLNPDRISANSQIARFEAGRTSLDQLPLWALQHDWGKAGHKALARFGGLRGHPDQAELQARIEVVRSETSKYRFTRAIEARQSADSAESLRRLLAVRPEAADLPADLLAGLPFYRMTLWLNGCNRTLPDGRPGCVLILGRFTQAGDARVQGMVLYLDGRGQTQADHLLLREGGEIEVGIVFDPVTGPRARLPPEAVAQALDGTFDIRPSGAKALFIGDAVLAPRN